MGGGGTNTTTQQTSTAPANPAVTATQTKLLTGLQGAYDQGMKVFDKPLYAGAGSTTQQGWNSTLGAAGNQNYAGGVNSAIADFADTASGNKFGMNAPGYATLRANAGNDAMSGINSVFNNSGRFGGGTHVQKLGEGVTNAYAGLDYANYQNDISRQQQAAQMLPSLYQASLAPGAAMGAVGAAQDQDAQARLMAENDLFRRQSDPQWDALARSSSILAGTAPVGGMNTTNTQTTPATPWYQSALGGALGLGAMFL